MSMCTKFHNSVICAMIAATVLCCGCIEGRQTPQTQERNAIQSRPDRPELESLWSDKNWVYDHDKKQWLLQSQTAQPVVEQTIVEQPIEQPPVADQSIVAQPIEELPQLFKEAPEEPTLSLAQQRGAAKLYVDAMMLNDLNEKDKAAQKLDAVLALDPDFMMAHSLKGDIYRQMEKYRESADSYEAATKLDPWSFNDFYNLGKVAYILEDFVRAANAYVRACELAGDHAEAHLSAAQCYYELEDYENAKEYIETLVLIAPNMSGMGLLLGNIYEAQKNHTDAIAAYSRALEIEGNKPEIMVPLAVSYLRTHRYDEAKELLISVIDLDPENGMAHQYLGYVYLKQNDTDSAIDCYTTAVEIDQANWMAHKSLGVAYIFKFGTNDGDAGMKAKGIEHWDTSLQLNPDQPKLRSWRQTYSEKY